MKKMRRYFLLMLLFLCLTAGATPSTSSDRSDYHQRVADVEFADSVAAYLRRNLDGEYLFKMPSFQLHMDILREITPDRGIFISLELTVTPTR